MKTEHTLESILVLYQMAVTGRPGPPCDSNAEQTKEVAEAIMRVLGKDGITLTGQQLILACGFAGIYVDPSKCADEVCTTEFTFENDTCVDEDKYKGMTVHQTARPDLGFQPLEPNKWPHLIKKELTDTQQGYLEELDERDSAVETTPDSGMLVPPAVVN